MRLNSRSTQSLNSLRVRNALKAVEIAIRHVPRQSATVSPKTLKRAVLFISKRPHGGMLKLAILLMFHAFLRQSCLLPRTVKSYDHTRQLTVNDVSIHQSDIRINLKWSKTQQKMGDCRTITLHSLPGSVVCPVRAARASCQPHHPGGTRPLIAFPDGNPMTTGYVKREWKAALKAVGEDPNDHTLHGLRRSGASHVYYSCGASLMDVKKHGGWRSECIRAYLRAPPGHKDTVQRALTTL